MRIKALALALALSLLASPSYAQVIIGGGGAGGGGSGTITGVTAGAGLTGGGTSGSVTLALSEALGNSGAAITGTTYSVDLADDMAKQLLFTGSSDSAWDDTGTATSGGFDIVNASASAKITWTPTDGIDGTTSLEVPAGFWAHIFWDGSTWRSEPMARASGVTAGSYGDSTHCVAITVDAYGRLTAASESTSCPGGGGGSGPAPSYTSEWWYTAYGPGAGAAAAPGTLGANTVYATPFWMGDTTINALGIFITTAAASGHLKLAVYAHDSTKGAPTGNPICATSDLATDSTGNVSGTCNSGSGAVTAGWYWFELLEDNTTAVTMAVSRGDNNIGASVGAPTQATLAGSSTIQGSTVDYASLTYATGFVDQTSLSFTHASANGRSPAGLFQVQ